jgi:hypothetical protein
MEIPKKWVIHSDCCGDTMWVYNADEIDKWLDIIQSMLSRLSIPLQGDHNKWGKKELADIINTKAEFADMIHKMIGEGND